MYKKTTINKTISHNAIVEIIGMEYNVNVRLDAYNKHLVDSSRVCEESEDVESQDL